MKKVILYLCAGLCVFALTACGGKDGGGSSQPTDQKDGAGNIGSTPDSSQGDAGDVPEPDSEGDDSDAEGQAPGDGAGLATDDGWSEEMSGLKAAVIAALGEDNYWPTMPLDAETFEVFYGIGADQYEDYMAEMPMISAHVDTLVIVRAKSDTADAVEQALTAYRDANVENTMQYPMNEGKIQAGTVERIGNYVIFAQLGADAVDLETEEAIVRCQEANRQAIDAVRGQLEP